MAWTNAWGFPTPACYPKPPTAGFKLHVRAGREPLIACSQPLAAFVLLTAFLGEADNARHHALWRHSAGR
ncbi:hypothetical protein EMIT053CA3_180103 [Pseudomonas donghuensis]